MEKMKQRLSSLKVSMIIYFSISLLCAQILYWLSCAVLDNAMLTLLSPKPDSIIVKNLITVFINTTSGVSDAITITNPTAFAVLKTLKVISPIIIFSLCTVVCGVLFYRMKLRKPLQVLEYGIERIARKELNFTLSTIETNELGRLCGAFEHMRNQLKLTFEALWKAEENQHNLYHAFAHDLRTPLTVIKGNNDLIELVASKKRDWGQVLQAISHSNRAVERIELYADQIRALESIEDWVLMIQEIDMTEFVNSLKLQTDILAEKFHKKIQIYCNELSKNSLSKARFDRFLVLRVLDNLIDNALCYATSCVSISICTEEHGLSFTICDDGSGFSPEALQRVSEAFFTTNQSGGHMGIGLTVCQKLLDIHGSSLQMENGEQGAKCFFSIGESV